MAASRKQASPCLVGLPGREVDIGKPGLHVVDSDSFLAQLLAAINDRQPETPSKGPRYGRHFFVRGYYFCRLNGSYGLCREMGGGGETLKLPEALLDRMLDDLGLRVSLESLVGVRMAVIYSKFGRDSMGTPRLMSLCTSKVNRYVDDPVPDLSGDLSPKVFAKNQTFFEGGADWF